MDQWTDECTDEWTDGPNGWTDETLNVGRAFHRVHGGVLGPRAAPRKSRRGWFVAAAGGEEAGVLRVRQLGGGCGAS